MAVIEILLWQLGMWHPEWHIRRFLVRLSIILSLMFRDDRNFINRLYTDKMWLLYCCSGGGAFLKRVSFLICWKLNRDLVRFF